MPNSVYPAGRNQRWTLDFVTSGEISNSWQNLTDNAKLKLPRNVLVEDTQGNRTNWSEKSIYGTPVGAAPTAYPLFMRGDRITIALGYFSDFDIETGAYLDGETLYMPDKPQFTGYISKIKNRLPIELECEDEMWKLKQIPAPNKLFKGSQYNVRQIIQECLSQDFVATKYVVTDGGFETNIGDFRILNETVAQVLERLRKDGGIYSYFDGVDADGNPVLRCSGIVYDPKQFLDSAGKPTGEVFEFQENIINDALEYNRKEDLDIAVKAYSQNIVDASGSNHDGTAKKQHKRIEVLVGKVYQPDGTYIFDEIKDPKTFHGDLVKFPVVGATTTAQLIKRAKEFLPKFYYTGFRGSFLTFGLPTVTQGMAAIIRDKRIPEREGTYLIKQVVTTFGISGFKQKINLHLRIDQGYTTDMFNAGIG